MQLFRCGVLFEYGRQTWYLGECVLADWDVGCLVGVSIGSIGWYTIHHDLLILRSIIHCTNYTPL